MIQNSWCIFFGHVVVVCWSFLQKFHITFLMQPPCFLPPQIHRPPLQWLWINTNHTFSPETPETSENMSRETTTANCLFVWEKNTFLGSWKHHQTLDQTPSNSPRLESQPCARTWPHQVRPLHCWWALHHQPWHWSHWPGTMAITHGKCRDGLGCCWVATRVMCWIVWILGLSHWNLMFD